MKPAASLSLDLDNEWSYLKTHGDPSWRSFPSYLDLAVPRILDVLAERDLKITFFVIGQDATLEKNRDALRSIAAAGHEIANHSYAHEPWLHLYSAQQLREEFDKAEAAIIEATGQRPLGFRGPGFSTSRAVIDTLVERGYEYDASILPSYLGPLARAFYFLRSPNIEAEERRRLAKLFGKFSDGFGTLKPHRLKGGSGLVEIPVTTFPVFKIPIHASYLMYLAAFSPAAAKAYWIAALRACRLTGVGPSLLLHPLDLMDHGDVPSLRFFPGMNVPCKVKLDLLAFVLDRFVEGFDVTDIRTHVRRFSRTAEAADLHVADAARL